MDVFVAVVYQRIGPALDDFFGRTARDCAAANHWLDAVLGHEIHGLLAGADHWLPGLDWKVLGSRNQRELLQGVSPVGDLWRKRVVLALVGEGFLVEGFHDDLNLFFEDLTVEFVIDVDAGHSEGVDLAGVVTTAHAKDDPPIGQDIGSGIVLGQSQRVPHGVDVEATAKFQVLGDVG